MTERSILPQDGAAQGFRTPIDIARNGEALPSDMMLGAVDDSSTFAEIRVLKLMGIGEYGSEYAQHARNIEREFRMDPNYLQQRREPYMHEGQPSFLWVPPAQLEEFSGLIAHPDRPDEWTGEPSDVQEWLHDAKQEAYEAGRSYTYRVIRDASDEPATHVFVTHSARRGISDWFQRDSIAGRNIRILPADVTTIPGALTALAEPLQTQAEVPARNIPNVLRVLTETYDRYGLR